MSKTENKIDNEIEELSEKMTKSSADAKVLLFDTIMELGPEGLKKASENMSEAQKTILKSALDEMAKAAKKPEPVKEDMTPEKTETPANSMKTEALSGSDDEDEKKLMNEKNDQHAHQGGPMPKDKPEGWEGQVVKAQGVPAGVDKEKWERGVKEVKKDPKVDNPYAVVNAAMTKGEETPSKESMKKLVEMEEAEHGKDINGDGKIAEKLEKDEKEKKMKKSLEEIVSMAKSLKMTKEEVVKAIKDAGDDLELVKGEMKKKMLAEEEQSKTKMQDESEKEKIKEDKGELEIKAEQSPDEIKVPMKKSIQWNPKNPLAANTLGRNTHYDVVDFIEKSEGEKQEIMKKGGYFGETQGEPLKKSETEKADINDLIEKGMDYSTDEIKRIEGVRDHKIEGRVVKSFVDKDIAAALGLTEEEARKLLGE